MHLNYQALNLRYPWNEAIYDINLLWLRHNCQCHECVHPITQQKRIDGRELELLSHIKTAQFNAEQDLLIHWTNDHKSIYPKSWIVNHLKATQAAKPVQKSNYVEINIPKTQHIDALPHYNYHSLTKQEQSLLALLNDINKHGMALIDEVPCQDKIVQNVAQLIAPIQPTLYGQVFDVVNTEHPINIAYTQEAVDFHMDLLYYESPPGLQLLHCMAFDQSIQGGESMLLDGFKLLEAFQKQHPEAINPLRTIPATFQKIHLERDFPVWMQYRRTHIVTNQQHELIGFNWSPAFEGPLQAPSHMLQEYYEAYILLSKFIQQEKSKMAHFFRLNQGSLAIFNNRRMLHGRTAFTTGAQGKQRHLQGTYINIDDYKSKLLVLRKKYNFGLDVVHVANQDLFY